jgi:hypothetical protein
LLNVGCTSKQDRPAILDSFVAMADETPPLMPDREAVVIERLLFIDACKAAFAADAQRFQWVFEKSLLTRSERWGLIWRSDFVIAGRPKSFQLVNRAMCWGAAEIEGTLVAFGQKIAPTD